MKENRHSIAIPANIVERVEAHLQETLELLKPYLNIGLTPRDRMTLPKMGPSNLDFIGTAFETARKSPEMLPVHADIADFEVDYIDARNLTSIENTLNKLRQGVSDMAMIAGSEALQSALMVYSSVKLSAAQKIPGAKDAYETMRQKYPVARRRGASASDTPEAEQ